LIHNAEDGGDEMNGQDAITLTTEECTVIAERMAGVFAAAWNKKDTLVGSSQPV
jgi:hypothetical protein